MSVTSQKEKVINGWSISNPGNGVFVELYKTLRLDDKSYKTFSEKRNRQVGELDREMRPLVSIRSEIYESYNYPHGPGLNTYSIDIHSAPITGPKIFITQNTRTERIYVSDITPTNWGQERPEIAYMERETIRVTPSGKNEITLEVVNDFYSQFTELHDALVKISFKGVEINQEVFVPFLRASLGSKIKPIPI